MISQVQRSGGRGLVAQTAAGTAGAGVLWRESGGNEAAPARRTKRLGKVAPADGGRRRQSRPDTVTPAVSLPSNI
jgi:hypothetical protein